MKELRMSKSKQALKLCLVLFSSANAYCVPTTEAKSQFTSRVFFLINEATPYQVQRSRRVIEREFADSIESSPELHGYRYQVQTDGNELIFSMVTSNQMQAPVTRAVSDMVRELNGRVQTKGRLDLMKTSLEPEADKSLEVVLDESNTRIQSIVARAITLRDFLSELKLQFGDTAVYLPKSAGGKREVPRFSYMISGDCAARQLDWSFASPAAKTLDETVQELAKLFKLSVENHQGTYIFSGDCPKPPVAKRSSRAFEFLPTHWIPMGESPSNAPAPPTTPTPIPVSVTR
jgi:hypothetical protein